MSARTHSEGLDQLAAALAKAQAEFGAIPKTETNPFFKSKYADLATVIKTAGPVATRHGLSVAQFLGCDENGDTLTTWLLHESGQFIAETMRLHLSKDDAQGQGSATSYARRYAYMAALGLVADEDDDGNAAAKTQARSQPAPRVVSAADVDDLVSSAQGLTVSQIRGAFKAVGLEARGEGRAMFQAVPKAKAAQLAMQLSDVKRMEVVK